MFLSAIKKMTMEQDDIQRYLANILREEDSLSSEEMAIFGKLIRLTVEYRDMRKAEYDDILTIEETRKALEVYEKALKDNKMPDSIDDKIAGLVKLWLKKINRLFF